ncbi:MAG: cupin domain-containing protein [Sulfobacillus benefaciens]|uniref:Cupin domain-containing protein n=1 Tax=Sulfobacillus benefaciens TaxID=453960 RepID=A0A2T2XH39_9FIRM|nr:MAG: cupin domain-containing protein [Sulfobacillus benefaciens]
MENQTHSLAEKMERYVVRLENREMDWSALAFQAEVDPRYRRAQIRYLGGGGTGKHDDPNVVPADHFTLSTMLLPPGSIGPLHKHHDVEEVFFVLQGHVTVTWEEDGVEIESQIGPRDMIWTPAGMYRGMRNDGDSDALVLVMLGTGRPQLPTYPPGTELEAVRLRRKAEREKAAANS